MNNLYKYIFVCQQLFIATPFTIMSFDAETITCPISGCYFTDPVTIPEDGHTYERSELIKWIKMGKGSPFTRAPIRSNVEKIHKNIIILNMTDSYLRNHPEEQVHRYVPAAAVPVLTNKILREIRLMTPEKRLEFVKSNWVENIPYILIRYICETGELPLIKYIMNLNEVSWNMPLDIYHYLYDQRVQPIHSICMTRHKHTILENVRYAVEVGGAIVDNTIFMNAILLNDIDLMRYLFEKGCNIHGRVNGRGFIAIAACYGKLAAMECVFELGAQMSTDRYMLLEIPTFFYVIRFSSNIKFIEICIKYGATMDMIDQNGQTAIQAFYNKISKNNKPETVLRKLKTIYKISPTPIVKQYVDESKRIVENNKEK